MSADPVSCFDPALLEKIRGRFAHVESEPHDGQRVYFENAGGSLRLKTVVEAVAECTALPDNVGRPSAVSRGHACTVQQGREDVSTLLGVRSGTVALGESTTSNAFKMLAPIVRNVAGNNVVVTNLDHPSVFDATRILAERNGKEWRVSGLCPKTGRVEPHSVVQHIDSQTIVLAIIHSSNILGTKNDVAATVRAARRIKPDLFVLVDGAQHAPHGVVDVEALGCDVYLASSYKTFGKPGGSVAYISERVAQLPHDQLLGKARIDWEQGTREPAAYAAWSKVVDYLCWLGARFTDATDKRQQVTAAMEAIGEHERALSQRLLHGANGVRGLLDHPAVTVYGGVDDLSARSPTFAFQVRGMSSKEVVARFAENRISIFNRVADAYSRHTLAALGIDECARVSLCHYNTPEEVDVFLATLEKTAS